MPRFPLHRPDWIALAAGTVQTVTAALAATEWFGTGANAAALILFGSWAALAAVVLICSGAAAAIVTLSTPPAKPTNGQEVADAGPGISRILKYTALLPLCQTAVGAVVVAVASLGGFTVDERVLMGPGFGGALGTVAMIALGAYAAVLCGVLLVLFIVVPAMMLWQVARRSAPRQSRISAAALAVIILVLLPLAIGAVLGVASPSGTSPRAAALLQLLTVLGFDFSDAGVTVQHLGWLWFARICSLVMVLAVAAPPLARRFTRRTTAADRHSR